MKKNNFDVGINVDKTDLHRTLDLVRKLKHELIEVEKQMNKIYKLGISKRNFRKILKDIWDKEYCFRK